MNSQPNSFENSSSTSDGYISCPHTKEQGQSRSLGSYQCCLLLCWSLNPHWVVELHITAGPGVHTLEVSYNSLSMLGGVLTTSKTSRCIRDSIFTTHGFPFCFWTFASWVAIWKESSFMIRDRFGSEKKCNSIKYYLLAGSTLIVSKINALEWYK